MLAFPAWLAFGSCLRPLDLSTKDVTAFVGVPISSWAAHRVRISRQGLSDIVLQLGRMASLVTSN